MTKHLDPRDRIIQEHAPTVMVPNYTQLLDLEENGHRFLAANDGVWLDIKRDTCSLRVQISGAVVPMPYGEVTQRLDFTFGRLSQHLDLLKQFLAEARRALPNEYAAWLVWDNFDKTMRYAPCETIAATPGSIRFNRPALDRHESCAVDLHSHAAIGAFFSAEDDADDAGEVKISGVLGKVDTMAPESAFRVCAMGVYIDVPVPAEVWR